MIVDISPCVFEVNDFYVTFKNSDSEDEDDLYSLARSKDPVKKKIGQAVEALSKELPDDVLEAVFGDHCDVVATPDKFSVTECEHD